MPEPSLRLAVALNGYGLEHDDPDGMWRELLRWEDLAGLARFAEELGYESIFTPEIGGWEAFTALAGMATETERIRLATGVVPLSARDPERLAMAAASLQELSGGRFTLGVGSRESIERTRVLVQALRGMIAEGEGYIPGSDEEARALEVDWAHAPARHIPLWLGALGPRMTELAGEVADGVILNWCTPERVAEAREAISSREDFVIAVYVRACLSAVDEHSAEALRTAASRYAAMEPYRRQFEAMGVDPSDTADVVTRTCVRGDRDAARERLHEYARAGADVVVVYPVPAGEAVSSLTGTLMAAAPDPALEH